MKPCGCKLLTTGSFQVCAGCNIHKKLLWTLPKPKKRKKRGNTNKKRG